MVRGIDIAPGRRVVILGADGFIGSAVVRTALGAGATVTAFCLKPPWRLAGVENDSNLTVADLAGWWEPGRIGSLEPALAGADAVALLAYQPPPDPSSAERHERQVNLAAAAAVGRVAARAGVRLVFTSSADVYGPWHEEPVTERTAPEPQTPYAEAKLEAEQCLAEAGGSRSIVSLRLATVYGPGEDGPRAIPSFINAFLSGEVPVLHGGGKDVRDYIHVEQVAAAIVNACMRPSPPGTINIGSGVGRSTVEVLRAVAAAMDLDPHARLGPSRGPSSRLIVDSALADRELGFDPRREFGADLVEEARWLEGRRGIRVAA